MKKLITLITICLIIIACSKDDVSKFNLTLDSTAGGNLNISTGTYDEDAAVTIIASPDKGYRFIGWSGSTDEITNPLIVSMTNDKSIKANFEEQINEVVDANGDFSGVGKWKIRSLPKSNASNRSSVCELSKIIFRTNGSFTIVTSTTTTTGRFSVDSNTTVSLKQEQNLFGTIKNLVLTNGFISFSIELNNGCTENTEGDKDKTYDESKDPITIDCSIDGYVSIDPDNGYCFKYKVGKNKIPGSECGYQEGETIKTYTIITHTETRLVLDVNTYDDSCDTPFSIDYSYSYGIDGDFLYETIEIGYNEPVSYRQFNEYSQSTYSLDNYCNK